MDICIIGDSHTVALKQGLPAVQDEFPDCRLVFFCGHGDRLKNLAVADGHLTAGSPELERMFKRTGGGESIGPHYDAYLLVGLTIRILRAARCCLRAIQEHRRAGQAATLGDDELRSLILADFETTLAPDVMRKLRSITAAPVFMIAAPYPCADDEENAWRRVERNVRPDRLAAAYKAACNRLCDAHDIQFLPQPQETLASNGVTTQEAFTRGATAIVERISDDTHMNAEFGAIVLREALRQIVKARNSAV